MRISIQPIQYGLNKTATSLEVYFGGIPFFSNEYCIKLELKDADTNLLDVIEVNILKDDYLALGETKEIRLNSILNQQGMFIMSNQEDYS